MLSAAREACLELHWDAAPIVGGSHCGAMHSLRSYPISIHSPARAPFCGDTCFIGNCYFAARHVCILPIHAGQRLAHTSD